jgi:hypothetical protein
MILPEDIAGKGPFYIASPFTKYKHGLNAAYVEILNISYRLRQRGVKHFSPIKEGYELAERTGIPKDDWQFWMKYCEPFVDVAPALIVAGLDGWRQSKGIGVELDWFLAAGKPRYLMDVTTLECRVIPC